MQMFRMWNGLSCAKRLLEFSIETRYYCQTRNSRLFLQVKMHSVLFKIYVLIVIISIAPFMTFVLSVAI